MNTLSYRIAFTTLLFSFFQYVKDLIHLLFIHLLFTISISQWVDKHEQTFNKMWIYSVSRLVNLFICIQLFNVFSKKKQHSCCISVENIGLEPMTLPMYRNALSQLC